MKTIVIDLETTGIPPKGANYETDFKYFPYILSMAWKVIKDGQESETFEYIINQEGQAIPKEATAINGITDAMCEASKMNIFTVLLQFIMDAAESDFVVGHNIYFDTSIIKANSLRIISAGKTPMDMFEQLTAILHKDKRIDTMRACHKLFGGKWPTLSESYLRLFQENFKGHSAGKDVDATYQIFQELIRLNAIKIALPEKVVAQMVEEEI